MLYATHRDRNTYLQRHDASWVQKISPFHLAIPVHQLAVARDFYENKLGYYKQEHGFMDGTQKYDLKFQGNSFGLKFMIYNPKNREEKKLKISTKLKNSNCNKIQKLKL